MPEEIKIDRKMTKNLNSDLPPSPTRTKNNTIESVSNTSSSSDD